MRKLLFTVITAIVLFLPSSGALSQEQQTANQQQQMQQLQQLLAQTKAGGMQPTTQSAQALTQPSTPVTSQMQYLPTQLQQMIQQAQAQPPTSGAIPAAAIPQSLMQAAMSSGLPPAPTATTPATTSKSQTTPPGGVFLGLGGGLQVPAAAQQNQQQQDNAPTMYDKAFDNTINQLVPLSPDQITKLHEVFDATQLAATTPPGIPAKPTTSSIIVNLSPQSAPPVIRLSAGYITSLVFMDGTGQPWPIDSYSIGNPGAFNIQWDKKGNTMLVQAGSFYKSSNLAVILKDLNTPVMLTLLTGQGAVDYRVDLRVPGIGPNAMFLQNGLPDSANPILLDVLNGIPPKGSRALKIAGGGPCDAWILNNKLYLRTSLDVISPAWQAVMSSIDGTHAYELQIAPVILALQHGKDKVLSLSVEGLE